MIKISSRLLKGTGETPIDVSIGSMVELSVTITYQDQPSGYMWEFIGIPSGSLVNIESPTSQTTKVFPLDTAGSYIVKLYLIKDTEIITSQVYTINVVESVSPLPPASSPYFLGRSFVKNYSFEITSDGKGLPANWEVIDPYDIMSGAALGVTRGVISSDVFSPPHGRTVLCLGDSGNASVTLPVGGIVGVRQSIDFTDINELLLNLKVVIP